MLGLIGMGLTVLLGVLVLLPGWVQCVDEQVPTNSRKWLRWLDRIGLAALGRQLSRINAIGGGFVAAVVVVTTIGLMIQWCNDRIADQRLAELQTATNAVKFLSEEHDRKLIASFRSLAEARIALADQNRLLESTTHELTGVSKLQKVFYGANMIHDTNYRSTEQNLKMCAAVLNDCEMALEQNYWEAMQDRRDSEEIQSEVVAVLEFLTDYMAQSKKNLLAAEALQSLKHGDKRQHEALQTHCDRINEVYSVLNSEEVCNNCLTECVSTVRRNLNLFRATAEYIVYDYRLDSNRQILHDVSPPPSQPSSHLGAFHNVSNAKP